jgi:hypothetical protein
MLTIFDISQLIYFSLHHNAITFIGISGREEEVGKGHGRVNMVQILCTHVCKWKKETC